MKGFDREKVEVKDNSIIARQTCYTYENNSCGILICFHKSFVCGFVEQLKQTVLDKNKKYFNMLWVIVK